MKCYECGSFVPCFNDLVCYTHYTCGICDHLGGSFQGGIVDNTQECTLRLQGKPLSKEEIKQRDESFFKDHVAFFNGLEKASQIVNSPEGSKRTCGFL
jgi:hypothetical protein